MTMTQLQRALERQRAWFALHGVEHGVVDVSLDYYVDPRYNTPEQNARRTADQLRMAKATLRKEQP